MLSALNPLLILAVVLACGLVGSWLARMIRLPSVTGQIVAGVAIGHSGLHLFDHASTQGFSIVTSFALAFIAASVGSYLQVTRLHNAGKRLVLLFLAEITITPFITWLAVVYVGGADNDMAVLLAAMAISTAPATILAIVAETRAKGVFVKTLVAAVAFNNVACIAAFEVARAFTRPAGTAATSDISPFMGLVVAAAIGLACGLGLVMSTVRMRREGRQPAKSLVALLLATGACELLGLSAMLSCLVLGATIANVAPRREKELGAAAFASLERPIFIAFFTLAGMHLNLSYLAAAGWLAAVLLVGRFIGKVVGSYVAMRAAWAPRRVVHNLGLALIPQAGVAVGLILIVTGDPGFEHLHQLLLNVGLTTVMLNEMIGPILTRMAIKRSGDFNKDRPRVIDFLNEENIIMDLACDTKREAIETLVDCMVRAAHLELDRDAFVDAVLAREARASTCVGGGLFVPHAVIDDRDEIAGAIGLSRQGLDFETPDGKPVHCVVLLATSERLTTRHLEVLGALARAVSPDHMNLGHRLFTARSPAHVYQLLNCEEEAEDFNYFLEQPH